MNRGRPYANRFVKRWEQDIIDKYHTSNLREIRAGTMREHYHIIPINHSKAEMFKEIREIQIDRENKALLKRMGHTMSKQGEYSVYKTKSIRTRANKSLNEFYRKKQQETIEEENKRFIKRLQNKRATLDVNKLNREWKDNENVIRRMSNQQFYLANIIKHKSQLEKNNSRKSIEDIKISKVKKFGEKRIFIQIWFENDLLKITGKCKDSSDLKIIEVPAPQATQFMEKECGGRMEKILDKLRYDANNDELYLVSTLPAGEGLTEENPENRGIKKCKPQIKLDYTVEQSCSPVLPTINKTTIRKHSEKEEKTKQNIERENEPKSQHLKQSSPKTPIDNEKSVQVEAQVEKQNGQVFEEESIEKSKQIKDKTAIEEKKEEKVEILENEGQVVVCEEEEGDYVQDGEFQNEEVGAEVR